MQVSAQVANIGDVSELRGDAKITRDQPYKAELDFNIQQNDNIETSNGRIAITFLDDSTVKLTEHSQLTIDEYIYTDFTATVDELGRSLIILLPDYSGNPSGEILVTTAMGSVTLNQPYQATTTTVFESRPSSPVILDLTLDQIDNMLIVKPPKQNKLLTEEDASQANNVLDMDLLEFDQLEQDYLAEDDLEFNELDINFLDTNFFEDMLKIMDELDKLKDNDLEQEQTVTRIIGTKIGQDMDTQIITLVTGDLLSLRRKVEQSVQVDLSASQGYTVIFIQNGISNTIKINGGGDSVITIKQSQ
jgi:hypothetical protein